MGDALGRSFLFAILQDYALGRSFLFAILRALRVIALLRKNSLFAGSDDAAQRFAQLLSLLATCQLHDVDPETWLADVLLAVNERGLIAEDLLPWNWKLTRGPSYRPYYDTS